MPCLKFPTAGRKMGGASSLPWKAISGRCLWSRLKPYAPQGSWSSDS